MGRALRTFGLVSLVVFGGIAGCATLEAQKVEAPKVELERVEVAHYWPFYLEAKERRGSPMDLAFILWVNNPNNFDVMLDELGFTVTLEPGFEVNTINVYEKMYIPPKRTNQLRVHVALDAYTTMLSLLVTGGFRLQEMGVKPQDQLKAWWDKVGDFGFKISVTNGTAMFDSERGQTLAYFQGEFPKK